MVNTEQQFKSILDFLKSRTISSTSTQKLSDLPWFLVVGQPESGKTEFLAGAEQPYLFTKKNTLGKKKQCSWWVTNEAVYLNVPGKMMLPNDNKKKNYDWLKLVSLLKKHQRHCTLHGVIIVIDSHDLLTRSDVSNHFRSSQLAQALSDLDELTPHPIATHLILNKCDLIPGFLSFFEDQGQEYREQNWGFVLDDDDVFTQEDDSTNIDNAFNRLIKQVNQQLLWHLHHESNENKRPLIKSFPLQLEHLKIKLRDILNGLKKQLNHANFTFSSFFLCSCTQYDTIDAALASHTSGALAEITDQDNARKRYFTKHLFAQITQATHVPESKQQWRHLYSFQFIIASCCLTALAIVTAYLSQQFTTNIGAVSTASNALATYQSQQANHATPSIHDAINALNSLSKANDAISEQQTLATRLIFSNSNAIKHSISNTQEYALHHIFIPALKQHLSHYLTTHENNPAQLYIGLKIYLMLGHQASLNRDYIATHLSQLFSAEEGNARLSNEATQLLLLALDHNDKALTLDQTLVTNVQQTLNRLQPSELAYIILFSEVDHSDIAIDTLLNSNETLFNIPEEYQRIPAIYTANEFQQVFPTQITQAVDGVINGNAVLGTPKEKRRVSSEQLTTTLKNIYLKEYTRTWVELLKHIQLTPTASMRELSHAAQQLSGTTSPILTLLSTVRENTNFPEILQRNTELNAFTALLDHLSDPTQSQLFQLFSAISALGDSAEQLATSSQPDSIFNAVKQKLSATGQQTMLSQLNQAMKGAPQPLNRWLQTLASNYWQLLLTDATKYINQEWQRQIVSVYNQQFSAKFPFNPSSKDHVNLNEFNQFFNKTGTLERFEENFIFPLMGNAHGNWQIKPEAASVLSISASTLNTLKHLAHIQSMYFSHNGKSTYADFYLQPLSADSKLQTFKVLFGKEEINYNPRIPNASTHLEWPSNTGNTIKLQAVDTRGKYVEKTFNQTWDWPKLVNDSASVPLAISDKTVELIFDVNGYKAKFLLTSNNDYNPFALRYLQQIKLPMNILELNAGN